MEDLMDNGSVDQVTEYCKLLEGNWDHYNGPYTVSDPNKITNMALLNFIFSMKLVIREIQLTHSGDADKSHHQVRCCHCCMVWRDISPSDMDSQPYLDHLEQRHPTIPTTQQRFQEILWAMSTIKAAGGNVNLTSPCGLMVPDRGLVKKTSSLVGAYQELEGIGKKATDYIDLERYEMIVQLIVERNLPFDVVESTTFSGLFDRQSPSVKVTKAVIVQTFNSMYDRTFAELKLTLQSHAKSGGKINLSIDAWKAGGNIPHIGITAHWMDPGFVLRYATLDYIRLPLRGLNMSQRIAKRVKDLLTTYGICKSLGSITADENGICGWFCDSLTELIPSWLPSDHFISCMSQAVNRNAHRIFVALEIEKADEDQVLVQRRFPSPMVSPAGVLEKVRVLVGEIRSSRRIWQAMKAIGHNRRMSLTRPTIDTDRRWSSMLEMVGGLISLKPALVELLRRSHDPELKSLCLSHREWLVLANMYKAFERLQISIENLHPSAPTMVNEQFPALSEYLCDICTGGSSMQHVHSVLERAWEASCDYFRGYTSTDNLATCIPIAVILDPRYKVKGLPRTCLNASVVFPLFAKEYRAKYASMDSKDALLGPNDIPAKFVSEETPECPTARWAREEQEPLETEPLTWWRENGHRYSKGLNAMARDYLSVPAGSASAERLFYRSGDLIAKRRERILLDEGRKMLLIRSWSKMPEFEAFELEQLLLAGEATSE